MTKTDLDHLLELKQQDLEHACAERDEALEQARLLDVELTRLNIRRTREAHDLETQLRFWKQACEHACEERDELGAMLEALQQILDLPPGCDAVAIKSCIDNARACKQANDDLNVQVRFWRQCSEHAVTGWNALEDKVEAAHEALNAIEGNLDAARELLGGLDEWAPPDSSENPLDRLVARERRVVEERITDTDTPLGSLRCVAVDTGNGTLTLVPEKK